MTRVIHGELGGGRDPAIVRLLAFARSLQSARSFGELLGVARAEVERSTGYRHAWLVIKDEESDTEFRLIEVAGDQRASVWEFAPRLDARGDAFLTEMLTRDTALVIEDARVDPRTNKQMVEKLQNRTLVNVPLMLLDAPFGIFGVGTFGDEGCRAPAPDELDYLSGMASQISVAASRLRWQEGKARAERERAVIERRLAQVQKLESIGLLSGGIAHDFNNLLTVIITHATFAKEAIAEPRPQADVTRVLQAADRARALTQQLLAVSRRQGLSLRRLDMNDVLNRLLSMMRRLLPENVPVRLLETPGLSRVQGDSAQLEQVFMNLLINARDAMPSGGDIHIETENVHVDESQVQAHPWALPGEYVRVTVTDTGTGIEREVLERIFEPFVTTKSGEAGTGLGLAVAYGIIRQHEGIIQCRSEVGAGTSFEVYLPVASRIPAAAAVVNVDGQPRRAPSAAASNARVLIAEDDEAVRRAATRILERAGYRVKSVASGALACSAVAHEDFDLVILDVVMPGPTCRETVESIWRIRPGLPILLASGYTASDAVTELIGETGLQLLRKPYDPEQMLQAARATLERARVAEQRQTWN